MVQEVTRKSMIIRPSGRSTDYISPSFGHGCLYNCSYCYMKRHKPEGLDVATNIGDILTEINSHCAFADVDKPNQTHDEYITYDISCNEDTLSTMTGREYLTSLEIMTGPWAPLQLSM